MRMGLFTVSITFLFIFTAIMKSVIPQAEMRMLIVKQKEFLRLEWMNTKIPIGEAGVTLIIKDNLLVFLSK